MSREWEAEHRGGGRFVLRARRRAGCLACAGFAALAGAGAVARLWARLDAWLRDTADVTASTATATLLVITALVWLWIRADRR